MIAINETTSEINNAIQDLKKSGIINNIASTVEETTKTIRETIQITKDETKSSMWKSNCK